MLRLPKSVRVSLSAISFLRTLRARWWLVMSDRQQREVLVRGSLVAVATAGVSMGLPAVSDLQSTLRGEAELREQAGRLAAYGDAGLAVRTADHTPALLDTPWLRNVEYTLKRDLDSSMTRYAMRDRDGAALATLASFRPEQIRRAETFDAELKCMAEAVYYEAGFEPVEGQLAVAEVVLNRVRDHRYPDTVCEVVYQGATRTTGCQFTFTCDGSMKRNRPPADAWARAERVAAHVLMDLNEEHTGGATHYHATYVDPVWNAGLIRTDRIGLHIFYRFPRGAEWARVERGFAERKTAVVTPAAVQSGEAAELAALDEAILFSDEPSQAPGAEAYIITPTVAPAGISTSTRTVSSAAPRLVSVQVAQGPAKGSAKPAAALVETVAAAAPEASAEMLPERPDGLSETLIMDAYMQRQVALAREAAGG